jgi:hypothetical protein
LARVPLDGRGHALVGDRAVGCWVRRVDACEAGVVVDESVAVVVDAVARFGIAGERRGVTVVAVGGRAVQVGVVEVAVRALRLAGGDAVADVVTEDDPTRDRIEPDPG